MARYKDALCRLCRREGAKLFLKGDRCYTEKCAFSRRPQIPGQHHNNQRRKISEFGKQLREKQKVKRMYGVLEKQFRKYFREADKKKGETGENLLKFLEERLDNVVLKAGFTQARNQARQLIAHGHVRVNGRKADIPSYQVQPGMKITLSEEALNINDVKNSIALAQKKKNIPTWIEMDFEKREAVVKNEPARTDITMPVQEQLIVELYSK
ncbi:MAG: 30S ribosomal protein S4 [Candidatus Goldiibacteriota bacterium]